MVSFLFFLVTNITKHDAHGAGMQVLLLVRSQLKRSQGVTLQGQDQLPADLLAAAGPAAL